MNVKSVIDVCKVRHVEKDNAPACNGCIYYGKTCQHAIKILKVNKPYEYNPQTN